MLLCGKRIRNIHTSFRCQIFLESCQIELSIHIWMHLCVHISRTHTWTYIQIHKCIYILRLNSHVQRSLNPSNRSHEESLELGEILFRPRYLSCPIYVSFKYFNAAGIIRELDRSSYLAWWYEKEREIGGRKRWNGDINLSRLNMQWNQTSTRFKLVRHFPVLLRI